MSELKAINSILTFCKGEEASIWIDELIDREQLTDEQKHVLLTFFENKMVELYKLSLEFSLKDDKLSGNHPQDVLELINQLSYWWLKVQSEWIRYNNLCNYKQNILHRQDVLLQAKASVCSYFLEPVARHLNRDHIKQNTEYLKNMVRRSQFT